MFQNLSLFSQLDLRERLFIIYSYLAGPMRKIVYNLQNLTKSFKILQNLSKSFNIYSAGPARKIVYNLYLLSWTREKNSL